MSREALMERAREVAEDAAKLALAAMQPEARSRGIADGKAHFVIEKAWAPSDPPPQGFVKLRLRSRGEWPTTEIVLVDAEGVERALMGVHKVTYRLDPNNGVASCELTIDGVEMDLEIQGDIKEAS